MSSDARAKRSVVQPVRGLERVAVGMHCLTPTRHDERILAHPLFPSISCLRNVPCTKWYHVAVVRAPSWHSVLRSDVRREKGKSRSAKTPDLLLMHFQGIAVLHVKLCARVVSMCGTESCSIVCLPCLACPYCSRAGHRTEIGHSGVSFPGVRRRRP